MNISLISFLTIPYEKQLETRLWRNSDDVIKYFKIKHIDEDTHKRWLKSLLEIEPSNIAFMIQADDEYVGVTYFHSINRAQKTADWGIYIYNQDFRGRGIGNFALTECIKYAQETLGLESLCLDVLETNTNAKTLYEKCGFVSTSEKDGLYLRYKKTLSNTNIEPKVSIICRTYNQEDFIGPAISSALQQTYQDFELIVIDDASTDKTAERILGFSDFRIKYIRNTQNEGPLANLNLGITKSCGKYICILDGDDEFLPTKLEKQVSFLDNNPDYGAVFSYINTIGDKQNRKIAKNCKIFEEILNKPGGTKAQMLRECFGTGTFLAFPSEMFRKEFACYWPPHLLGLSETNFHLSMLMKTKIKVLEEPLVNYRVMENYTDKWTTTISLQNELFFILDTFLDIKSVDLFKEVFQEDLKDINIPIEESLLPYILTKIAEKDAAKRYWANYNFHRFIKDSDNYNLLKSTLNLTYLQIFEIKSGRNNYGPPTNELLRKKLKKYRKISQILGEILLATLAISLYLFITK